MPAMNEVKSARGRLMLIRLFEELRPMTEFRYAGF
jgi:transposase